MGIAGIFSQAGLAVIAGGLIVATLAGAQTTGVRDQAATPPLPAAATNPAPESAETKPEPGRWAQPALEPQPAATPAAASLPVGSSAPAVEAATAPAAGPPPAASAAPEAPPAPAATATATAPATPPAAAPAVPAAESEHDKGGTPGLKPAKVLFGAVKTPVPLAARAIGTYARGCLSGGQALPVDGPAWQAMRLSRNRNWGHPKLVALVEKLAIDGKAMDGWPGLLVGDLAQPRGGPMSSGHASHQIGLDADIWLTPMPDRRLTDAERETIEATSMLGEDGLTVARDHWTEAHLKIIKRAASYPEVERILIHPAIKQVLCHEAGSDRQWLAKVRPYWGHYYHFHVRIGCPSGSGDCEPQKAVPGDDGCGKEVDDWLTLLAKIKPEPPPLPLPPQAAVKPPKEKPPITLDQLPSACRVVLATGNPDAARDIAAAASASAKRSSRTADPKPEPKSAAKAAEANAAKTSPGAVAATTKPVPGEPDKAPPSKTP